MRRTVTISCSRCSRVAPPRCAPPPLELQAVVSSGASPARLSSPCVQIKQPLDLSAAQRQSLVSLRQLVLSEMMQTEKGSSSSLVACWVQSSTKGAGLLGVNFQFYQHRNPRGTLRGLLKGCAEQNALGSYAAQGHCFADVTDVFLFGRHTPEESAAEDERCSVGRGCAADVMLPCRECWQHLCDVADQVVVQRGEFMRPSLFVGISGVFGIDAAVQKLNSYGATCESKQGPSVILVPFPLS